MNPVNCKITSESSSNVVDAKSNKIELLPLAEYDESMSSNPNSSASNSVYNLFDGYPYSDTHQFFQSKEVNEQPNEYNLFNYFTL